MSDGPPPDPDAIRKRLEVAKLRTEVRKLHEEHSRLKFENSWRGRVLTSLTALSVIVAGAGLVLTYRAGSAQRDAERRQTDYRLISDDLERASDPQATAAKRYVAVWSLVPFWSQPEHDELLANALAAILVSDENKDVRLAAADVIGLAIRPDSDRLRKQQLVRVLYGSSASWDVGAVVAQAYAVSQTRPSTDAERAIRAERLLAVREAIRKNWECLEYAHFGSLDLSDISLAGADLQGAYFGHSVLDRADLRAANVQDAKFEDVSIHLANIQSLRGQPKAPRDFKSWALDHGAVEMDRDSYQVWSDSGFPQPPDWASWRRHAFRVDSNGRPRY